MQITSTKPLKISATIYLEDPETGRVRRYVPGEVLPEEHRDAVLKRVNKTADAATASTGQATAPASDAATQPAADDVGAVVVLDIDVTDSTVAEIADYIEANPDHADDVLAAETAARNGKPRKGVVEAAESANEE